MPTRIVALTIAAVLSLLSTLAAGHVAPVPPACAVPQTGPTEVDRAYYYSTIGQELTYAKIQQDAARKRVVAAPSPRPPMGSRPQVPSVTGPLSPLLCPPVPALCPAPSRLLSRLEAAGCRL